MAANAPDPRSLASWDDAFQYPIVAVRGMEKKLRRDIDENHEKLRTLVGASYRDLLGTARTIVDVNAQMERVEDLLVDIGHRSDSRILDKIASNYTRLEKGARHQDKSQLALASQLSVLQKCLHIITRLLRTYGSTLLVAKLVVVARLLQKTLSLSAQAPPVVETLGTRLVSLRQRLLRHIDHRLARETAESAVLVDDMTAFSLATSSTPTDVLRHFQHLRLDAVCRPLLNDKENVKESILRRIRLFLVTLRDSKAIFPDVLAASLKALGARPLLDDNSIIKLDELGFDVHRQWFADDVKNYAPYTRHDELSSSKADELMSSWSRQVSKAMTDEITSDVGRETNLQEVVEVRRETLQLWLSSKSNTRRFDWTQVLTDLRLPFLQQVQRLINDACTDLQSSISDSIISTVDGWNAHTRGSDNITGLWDLSTLSADMSNGALSFRNAIIERRCGRQASIVSLLRVYENSASVLNKVQGVVKSMKDTRWEDEEDDDYDEVYSTRSSDVLSKQDPEQLQIALRRQILLAVEQTQRSISTYVHDHRLDCSSELSSGLFVLRALRELRYYIPRLLESIDRESSRMSFCQDLVVKLHDQLANAVVLKTDQICQIQSERFVRSKQQVQSLWVGNPILPIQPTPATFRCLRATVKEMEAFGQDLWSPDAVTQLREVQNGSQARHLFTSIGRLEQQVADFEVLEVSTGNMKHQHTNSSLETGSGNGQALVEEISTTQSVAANPGMLHGQDEDKNEGEAGGDDEGEDKGEDKGADKVEGKGTDDRAADSIKSQVNGEQDDEPAVHREPTTPTAATSTPEPHPPQHDSNEEPETPQTPDKAASTNPDDPTAPSAGQPPEPEEQPTSETPNASTVTPPATHEPTRPPQQPRADARTVLQTDAKLVQLLFDALYLSHALSAPGGDEPTNNNPLGAVVVALTNKAGLGEVEVARVRKAAAQYWRRTYLLFGLLVGE